MFVGVEHPVVSTKSIRIACGFFVDFFICLFECLLESMEPPTDIILWPFCHLKSTYVF